MLQFFQKQKHTLQRMEMKIDRKLDNFLERSVVLDLGLRLLLTIILGIVWI